MLDDTWWVANDFQVLYPGKVWVENRVFQNGTNALAGVWHSRLAKPLKVPAGWVNHAERYPQRGGLTASIGAENAEDTATFYLQ